MHSTTEAGVAGRAGHAGFGAGPRRRSLAVEPLAIVRRPKEQKGFVALPRRWVVERTFAWLNNHRRLSKDYERLTATSEALIYIVMMRLMVKRLTR